MAGSEVALNAAAQVRQRRNSTLRNYGAREGDEAAHPFFGGSWRILRRRSGNARSQFFDHLFFGESLPKSISRWRQRRRAKFAAFVGAGRFKSIEKTEAAGSDAGDDGKKPRRNERDHAAEAEAPRLQRERGAGIADH